VNSEQLLQNGLLFFGAFGVLLVIRHFVLRSLRMHATSSLTIPHVAYDRLRIPTFLWCLAGALDAAVRYLDLTARQEQLAHLWIVLFLIVSFTMVGSALLLGVIEVYGSRKKVPFAVAGLSRTIIQVLVFSLGLLSILRYLGIPVTPMLATLGVGGLAVALALQDTLVNFFAGVHILIEGPISVGNKIKIDELEGMVIDIGWRTTRLLNGSNSIIVIPNKKMVSDTLTNYDMPDPRVIAELLIFADRDTDPQLIQTLALKAVQDAEGPMQDFGVTVLMDPGVTQTHLQMKVIFSVKSHNDLGVAKSNVNFLLNAALRANGVKFPRTN
jgi:small-conductance mechanosensitive channel